MAKKPKFTNNVEDTMVKNLDSLIAYDEYQEQVAPMLRQAVTEKWSAERIFRECESLLAARIITMALTEKDPMKALAAQKEAFDRSKGKAMQKQEITNKLDKLTDEELDSLLAAHGEESPDAKH